MEHVARGCLFLSPGFAGPHFPPFAFPSSPGRCLLGALEVVSVHRCYWRYRCHGQLARPLPGRVHAGACRIMKTQIVAYQRIRIFGATLITVNFDNRGSWGNSKQNDVIMGSWGEHAGKKSPFLWAHRCAPFCVQTPTCFSPSAPPAYSMAAETSGFPTKHRTAHDIILVAFKRVHLETSFGLCTSGFPTKHYATYDTTGSI